MSGLTATLTQQLGRAEAILHHQWGQIVGEWTVFQVDQAGTGEVKAQRALLDLLAQLVFREVFDLLAPLQRGPAGERLADGDFAVARLV